MKPNIIILFLNILEKTPKITLYALMLILMGVIFISFKSIASSNIYVVSMFFFICLLSLIAILSIIKSLFDKE